VLRHESRHQRRHVAAAETGRRGDTQVTTGFHTAGADTRFCIRQVGQQALAVFKKGAAFVGQGDAAGGAREELHAQALFQRIDAPADHRRGDAFGGRRCGEAAFGGHGHEGLELFELVHGARRLPASKSRIPNCIPT
jgi:hypothetical protein